LAGVTIRTAGALAALCLGLALPQDPQPASQPASRPQPPADWQSRPLPPVDDPPRTAVERKDLMQQFTPPNPLEGCYELRDIVRPGMPRPARARGYLWIGRRHMSLHLQGDGETPRRPYLQASFRSYRVVGPRLVMNVIVGHRNDGDGDVLVEQPGLAEERTFQLIGPVLRIHQGPDAWHEYVRIE
jgi:hypothetical protein